MNKIILTLAITLISLGSFAQGKLKGNKVVVMEDREMEFFNMILVKDNIEVDVFGSSSPEVTVEADENLMGAISTRVSGDVLEIYLNQPISYKKKLLVHVGITDSVLTLETRDKANVKATSEISLSQLNIMAFDKSKVEFNSHTDAANISTSNNADAVLTLRAESYTNFITDGSSTIKATLETGILNSSLQGNSSIRATGICKSLHVTANAGSNFVGKELVAENGVINSLERSDVAINATNELEISAENESEVYIYGNPKIVVTKFTDKATLFKK